ncbi:MAG: hypothetical protein ACO3A4_14095 [Silvanigrellaceae bacterium]
MKNVMLLSGLGLLAVVTSACGKKSDDGGASTTGSFLTPASFTGVTPTALTVDEVKAQVDDATELFDNVPGSGSSTPNTPNSPSTSNDPMTQCMNENQPKLAVIGKETLNISAEIDLAACLKSKAAAAGQTPTSGQIPTDDSGVFKLKLVANFTCPGADLSALAGKTIEELDKGDESGSGLPSLIEEKCKDLPSLKLFMNSEFTLAGTQASGTQKVSFSLKKASAMFNKDGGACELVKVTGGYKMNGCLDASLSEVQMPDEKKTDLQILEATDLVDLDSSTATWFNGGSYKATFNNFTGTITYTDSSSAPTYSLTASGGLTATGTVQEGYNGMNAREMSANPFGAVQRYVKSLSKLRPGSIR